MKTNSRVDRWLIWLFVCTWIVMAAVFIVKPKLPFSELENRTLQSMPGLSWEALASGVYAEQLESYISDHFPYREAWIKLKSTMEQLRLQQENNEIFKGKDGYLFEKFDEPDLDKARKYLDSINHLAARNPDGRVTFMLIPTSVGIYPDKLPWLASSYSQETFHTYVSDQLEAHVTWLDGFDILRSHAYDEKPIYYRTDHHWTTYGAYWGYRAYAASMGWEPIALGSFKQQVVSASFLGSYHTKSQFSGTAADIIEVMVPPEPIASDLCIADTGDWMDGLYDESFLGKKDQYAYFLGGVHALMTIHNEAADGKFELDKLLIVKDSYAHNLIPFLTAHVEEIHVIDPRYYNGSISDYMEDQGISEVLLLFQTGSIAEPVGML